VNLYSKQQRHQNNLGTTTPDNTRPTRNSIINGKLPTNAESDLICCNWLWRAAGLPKSENRALQSRRNAACHQYAWPFATQNICEGYLLRYAIPDPEHPAAFNRRHVMFLAAHRYHTVSKSLSNGELLHFSAKSENYLSPVR
jgi:hypothetical protein